MSYKEDSQRYRNKHRKHPLRRISVLTGLLLASVGYWTVHSAAPLLDRPIGALLEDRLGKTHPYLAETDRMRAFVCGSSSPIATAQRAKTCIGVVANGEILLFDVGAGSIRNIEGWGLGAENVRRVFLTHFHSDHLGDLDEANVQGWIWGRTQPMRVHGPVGVERVVAGYNEALALDYGYRNEYGTEQYLPRAAATMIAETATPVGAEAQEIYRNGALVVEAFLVDHAPVEPALGYRVTFGDRTIVISGDTRRSQVLEAMAEDADVLFQEAQSARLSRLMAEAATRRNNERIRYVMSKAGDYHTASEEFGDIASATRARQVVMYHLSPPPDNWLMQRVFLRGMPGNVMLAEDGLMFELVPGEDGVDPRSVDPL